MAVYRPDGTPFATYDEREDRLSQERDRADRERERADRLASRLRNLGIDPDAADG